MSNQDYYRTLGLQEGASMNEIKSAYRRLALRYHPDRNVSKKDEEKFKLITEAYGILRSNHSLSHTPSKMGYVQYPENNLDSKFPYWNDLKFDRVFKDWLCYSKYAEKTYRDFCKYEQESWNYCGKIKRIAIITVLSYVASGRKAHLFHSLYSYRPTLKKGLENIKSKLKL